MKMTLRKEASKRSLHHQLHAPKGQSHQLSASHLSNTYQYAPFDRESIRNLEFTNQISLNYALLLYSFHRIRITDFRN